MNFDDIKTILYNSEAILQIPEGWQISLPFLCFYEKKKYCGFMVLNGDEIIEIKQVILISCLDGSINIVLTSQFFKHYNLKIKTFSASKIEDYEIYFKTVDKYELNFYDYYDKLNTKSLSFMDEEYIKRTFKKIYGIDLYNCVFEKIFNNFYEEIKKKK